MPIARRLLAWTLPFLLAFSVYYTDKTRLAPTGDEPQFALMIPVRDQGRPWPS